jgi:hypothetical protein
MGVFTDTHETIKQLVAEGGMTERGAEILVTALNKGFGESVADKTDIAEVKGIVTTLRADVTGRIDVLKTHVDGVETRLTNRIYIVGIAMVGLLSTINHFWK